ncbi:GNAT family N-acetyltransferase [Alkalihalobacillus sp. MEB130]|uniref:GNAT family N-acetyltransferase n=1 Tax=Alkalihalobacillus sp. MEB130 TaxID=2976704 RepID=UPI0028DD5F6B|nr:GNAT family N-acetyltransferase [Alkalihalobacillus sp. MEB130]MDT8861583.1 GNAT family N-acetyltransferase [Alkalihalobacillus sp. MEB130]
MLLQTDRLLLIPCTSESIALAQDQSYEIGPHTQAYVEELKEDSSLLGWGVWFVIHKDSNTIVGDIGFKGKADKEQSVEVGYGIMPTAQNQGYATEAVNELLKWAFTWEQVKKVVAECLVDNGPSIKVLEKLNMSRVKTVDNMIKWELNKN